MKLNILTRNDKREPVIYPVDVIETRIIRGRHCFMHEGPWEYLVTDTRTGVGICADITADRSWARAETIINSQADPNALDKLYPNHVNEVPCT